MNAKTMVKTQLEEETFFNTLDSIIQPKIKNNQETIEIIDLKGKEKSFEGKGIIGVKKGKITRIAEGYIATKSKENDKKIFSYTPIDTIESVRNGIDNKDFKIIYDLLNFSNKKWAEILGVTEKTVQKTIIKEEKPLKQKTAEKFLSFLLLVKYGIEVFGSQESFHEWLNYKAYNLNNKAPIEYVDTVQGIGMLKEQIFKIETGNLI
ncbi:MAG: antitoxin Xre/MbcA/ParS toxin-binding domain-containing protein [Polaribacter sp.]